jgi:hypothetical protein
VSYRNDLDALAARRDALATEVAQTTKELGATEQLLADAKRRASLPVLDNIRVASPCKADWAKMTIRGTDERVRHCGDCKKNVFNISNMTRAEAEALIVAKNGDLCVRYFKRYDGTILLADCEIGAKKKRRKMKLVAAGAAALLAAGAGVFVTTRGGARENRRIETIGDVAGEYEAGKVVSHSPTTEPAPELIHEGRR